jgi:hypothetical protein
MKIWYVLFLLISGSLMADSSEFVSHDDEFMKYLDREDVLLIASPGRSGSTLLTSAAKKHAIGYKVVKTHRLAPKKFKGKILFIFSNPDQAAESALFLTLHFKNWGNPHFSHVFSSDQKWLKKIGGDARKQTLENNYLSYDALGVGKHLKKWLIDAVAPSSLYKANVLAIKYENLWDVETRSAIMQFLSLEHWDLPEKKQRGYLESQLTEEEKSYRKLYNSGSSDNPRYEAYDTARQLWILAPPFQFLKLKK